MEQSPAAAATVSSGEVHTARETPAFFQDPSALQAVFAKLEPMDLCALVQTCRTLRQLADTPWVWKAQAEKKWGALAAPHLGGYISHKALLLDACRRSAVLSLPLPQDAGCSYVYQQPHCYYKCKLLQLQWVRGDNSLRLGFDARGEPDLRQPITSSLAIVQLQPSRQQPQHTNPANTSAAAAATAAAAAAGLGSAAAGAGAVALDWSRKLAVFAPDDCQLTADTPGHFKGVLVWHSSKCSSILSLLLTNQQQTAQQQQQQQGAPPQEQHQHAQRSRRSEAWEEWAGWELEQQQQQQQEQQAQHAAAGAGSSSGSGHNSDGWLMSFLQAVVGASGYCQQQQHPPQQLPISSLGLSSSGSTGRGPIAAAAAAGAPTAPAAEIGLVFCYANDLSSYSDNNWTGFGLQPDYRPALLVASPGSTAAEAAAQHSNTGVTSASSDASGSATVSVSSAGSAAVPSTGSSVPALPVVDLQLPVQLHHPQEAQWAAAWLKLPAACVQQRGLLEQQLQAENDADENARWSDLPEAVRRRGAAWWK